MGQREVQRQLLRRTESSKCCWAGRAAGRRRGAGSDGGDGRVKPHAQPVRRGPLLLLLVRLTHREALLLLPDRAHWQRAHEVIAEEGAVVLLLYFRPQECDGGRHDSVSMLLLRVARAARCPDVAEQRQTQGLPQECVIALRLLISRPGPRLVGHDCGCGVRRPGAADVLPQVQQPVFCTCEGGALEEDVCIRLKGGWPPLRHRRGPAARTCGPITTPLELVSHHSPAWQRSVHQAHAEALERVRNRHRLPQAPVILSARAGGRRGRQRGRREHQ